MLRSNGKLGNHVVSPEEELKKGCNGKDSQKRYACVALD